MDKMSRLAFLFLLCIAQSSTVANANSGENSMEHKSLVGSGHDSRDAFKKATAVFEATVMDQGLVSPGPPGEAHYEGMRIKVTHNFKGQRHGEMLIDLSVKTLPLNESESVPQKGDAVIVFVGGDAVATNRVLKILLSTPENRDSVQRIKNQPEAGKSAEDASRD